MILTKSIIISAILISTTSAPFHTHTVLVTGAEPTKSIQTIAAQDVKITDKPDTARNAETVITINKGKEHEQCMRESFEMVYKQINAKFSEFPQKTATTDIEYM